MRREHLKRVPSSRVHDLRNLDDVSFHSCPPNRRFRSPDEVLVSICKVVITVEGGAERRTCDGETIVVNLHGALIATAIGLSSGMRISIHVYLTNKRAAARVVYIDPKNPLRCGIELDEPRNIWGVSVPPDDWYERDRQ